MKKYIFDTSGLTNPLEVMPEDIHITLWDKVMTIFGSGQVFVNTEIFDEMVLIEGDVGSKLKNMESDIKLEIGEENWNWAKYVEIFNQMKSAHAEYISEYNQDRKGTIGLNDLSIIAMAKTLGLPLVNMEKETLVIDPKSKRRRIPDICRAEGVQSMTFNEFLRAESISM